MPPNRFSLILFCALAVSTLLATRALLAAPILITTSTAYDPAPRMLNTSGTYLIADGATLTFANGLAATGTDGGVFAYNGSAASSLVIAPDAASPDTGAGRALFQNNTAGKNGGAISIANSNASTSLTLINVTFDANHTNTGYGGALSVNRASTLTNVVFTSNTAATNGGAFYNTGSSAINGAGFDGNYAGTSGGAFYNSGNVVTITSATFASNTARTSGGAIYSTAAAAKVALTDATFTHNEATTGGGAIYASNGTLAMNGAYFDSNKTTGASSSHGGAIYLAASATLALTGGTFSNNTAVNNGGALYGTGANTKATLDDITFTHNEATNGGALHTASGSYTITRALFTANKTTGTSSSHGGAIHNAGATLAITSATLAGNTTKNNGGAFYNTTASARTAITDAAIKNNEAAAGGGLYVNSGAVTVDSTRFEGNVASSSHGGAIYASTAASLNLTDVTFVGNTAGSGNGGAIYTTRGTLTIRATTSATNTGNKASGATGATGGFLYITGTDVTVNFDITGATTRYVIGDADAADRTLDTIASGGSGAAAIGHTINKTGDGALVLNADNSNYRGAITITAGALLLGNTDARLNAAAYTLTGGALGGIGTLTGGAEFRATSTLFVDGGLLAFATTATTGVTLRDGASIGGSGTLALTGADAAGNTLALDGGVIAATVAAGETLAITAALTGAGALEKRDAGTLRLTDTASAFTGGITLAGGTLAIDDTAQLGAATNEIRFTSAAAAPAALRIDAGDQTLASAITLAAAATGAIDTQNFSLTLTGPLASDATATLAKTGAGTLTLANANTVAFAGTLRAAQGTLALPNLTLAGNLAANAGATIRTSPTSPANPASPAGSAAPSTLTIGGTLALDNATLAFAFHTGTAPDGYLNSDRILATAIAATGSNTIDIRGFIQTGSYNLGNLAALASTATVALTVDGAEQLPDFRRKATLHTSGSLLLVEAQVDMSRALFWTGGGSGATASHWSGATAGQWTDTGAVTRFADGDRVTFQNIAGAIDIQTPVTVSDITVAGNATTTFTGAPITADAASALTGTLTGATGRLLKTGPGTLAFENTANTFSGGITLEEGAIAFTHAAQLAAPAINITGNATLSLTAAEETGLDAPITIAPAATATIATTAAGGTLTLRSAITGSGGLTKTGPGTLTLAAPATHAGPTLIQSGALRAAAANVLPRASPISLAAGATLDLGAHDQPIAALTTRGTVNLRAARLTIAGDYAATRATLQLTLALSDTAAPCAGTLAISGSATGATTVSIQLTDTRAQAARAPLPAGTPALITTDAASPGATFTLAGNQRLVVGAYDYLLLPDNAAAAREWRLVPDNFSPEIPAVAGADAIALQSSRAALDTLLARLDDLRAPASDGPPARTFDLWADVLHRRDRVNQTVYTGASIATTGLQAGAGLVRRGSDGKRTFRIGFFTDLSDAEMNLPRGARTEAAIRATGLYATAAGNRWHADAIVRGGKTSYDITAPAAATFATDGSDFGATIQTGRIFTTKSNWRIEPLVALAYQRHAIDATIDSFGRACEVDDFTSLIARLAAAFDRAYATNHGLFIPRIRLSALHEFDGKSRMTIDGNPIETDLGGLGAELDASLIWRINNHWSLTAAAAARAGGKFDGYSLRLGASCAW